MKNQHLTKQLGTALLLVVLLLPLACKRDQLQPAPPSLLGTYHGTDKMVLQVIDQLQQPANRAILAELEKQGSINWQYKALFSSRFIKGYTLRFALGSSGNYLDAEIDAKTGEIKLFTKQMQLSKDQQVKQHFKNSRLKQGNGTLSSECVFFVFFEVKNYGDTDPADLERLMKYWLANYYSRLGQTAFVEPIYNYLIILAPSGTTAAQVETVLRSNILPFGVFIDVESLSVIGVCEDENGTIIQDIPPITWEQASPTTSSETGESTFEPKRFVPYIKPFREGGFWKIAITAMHGGASILIRTGGLRDPYLDPPTTASQANDAIDKMGLYFIRGSASGWHTTAASLAHENYHYTEHKAIANYYWPLAAACIHKIRVLQSGDDASDIILAENMAYQILTAFVNTCADYHDTLNDSGGGRAYAAGQLELNKAITMVKQLADSRGWWTTGSITIPNVDISNPTYQPFLPFNCPF